MSADTRYNRLQSKVNALEAAGRGKDEEAVLARAAMEEVRPLLTQTKAQQLLDEIAQGGKVDESAKPAKASRAAKPAKAGDLLTDTVTHNTPAAE